MKMEFSEISVKDSPGLCRCCLSEGCYKDMGTEYTWMNETEVYADMLLDCFDVGITQHNDGPNGPKRLICEVCITRLRDACNFKKQVLDSEKKFIDMLGRGEFRSKVLIYQDQLKSEAVEVSLDDMDTAAEVEYLDDIDFQPDDMEPLSTIKRELPSSSSTDAPRKRGRPRKDTTEPQEKKIKKTDVKKTKITKDDATVNNASQQRRITLQTLFNNTTIIPFKWRSKFICFYCGDVFNEYMQLKEHTVSHGNCSTTCYALKNIKGAYNDVKIDISDISCKKCDRVFKSLEVIIDHLIYEHRLEYDKSVDMTIRPYRLVDNRCTICELELSSFKALVVHCNEEHSEKYHCHICGRKFFKKSYITNHLRICLNQKGYTCKICGKNFPESLLLLQHRVSNHLIGCPICGEPIKTWSFLHRHMRTAHATGGFKDCYFCQKKFHSLTGLKIHVMRCEKNIVKTKIVKEEVNTSPRKRNKSYMTSLRQNIKYVLNTSTAIPFTFKAKYSCFYCPKSFVNFDDLTLHTQSTHTNCDINMSCIRSRKGTKTYCRVNIAYLSCKICNEPMKDLLEFVDHAITKHDAEYDKSIDLKECFEPYIITKEHVSCPDCPKTFTYFSSLLRHKTLSHSNLSVICDYCGRGFKNTQFLRVHITANHTGFCECSTCGAKLKNNESLIRHMGNHHKVKYIKCLYCPELFYSHYQKLKHSIQAHNDGVKCEQCDRVFTKHSFMKNHVRRTHLKEKTVPCTLCGMKFFDNFMLRNHMVKHDGERKFKCEQCGRAFLRQKNLRSHMDTHNKYS